MTEPFTLYDSKVIPQLDDKGRSAWFLGLVITPSAQHWDIVHYDSGYRKSNPWRTHYNHGVSITCYYSLPEIQSL